jgi:hypothetical protein
MKIVPVIMLGGSGSRLWALSSKKSSKTVLAPRCISSGLLMIIFNWFIDIQNSIMVQSPVQGGVKARMVKEEIRLC